MPRQCFSLTRRARFLVFTDYCVYWIHRLEHHPAVYKYVHKPHHKWLGAYDRLLVSTMRDLHHIQFQPLLRRMLSTRSMDTSSLFPITSSRTSSRCTGSSSLACLCLSTSGPFWRVFYSLSKAEHESDVPFGADRFMIRT